jgi:hypothetical protein
MSCNLTVATEDSQVMVTAALLLTDTTIGDTYYYNRKRASTTGSTYTTTHAEPLILFKITVDYTSVLDVITTLKSSHLKLAHMNVF